MKTLKLGLLICPECGTELRGVEKSRVLGTFNTYKNFCRNCNSEIEFIRKNGFYKEVYYHISLMLILIVFLIVIGVYTKYDKNIYALTSIFILIALVINFIDSLKKLIEVKKVEPKYYLLDRQSQFGVNTEVFKHMYSTLLRQAQLRFGTETATALAPLLERVTDPEQLTQIGEWIILCVTGKDLLDRVRTMVGIS